MTQSASVSACPAWCGLVVLVRSESVVGVLGEVVVPGVVVGGVAVEGAGDCVVVVGAPVGGGGVAGDVVSEVDASGFVVEPSVVDAATAIAADLQ